MFNWLLQKWDWFIYHRACHSLKRMCINNPCYAYLIKLWLEEWISQNPIPETLKESTEKFFDALKVLEEK